MDKVMILSGVNRARYWQPAVLSAGLLKQALTIFLSPEKNSSFIEGRCLYFLYLILRNHLSLKLAIFIKFILYLIIN